MTDEEEAERASIPTMIGMAVAIWLMPYVFVWFVLNRSYPLLYRIAAFAWFIAFTGFILWFIIYGFFMGGHSPPARN